MKTSEHDDYNQPPCYNYDYSKIYNCFERSSEGVHLRRSDQKSCEEDWTEHSHFTEKWPHTEINLDTVIFGASGTPEFEPKEMHGLPSRLAR